MKLRALRIFLVTLASIWIAAQFIAPRISINVSGQTRQPARRAEDPFKRIIQPFIAENCAACHNAKSKKGDLDLQAFRSVEDIANNRERWELIARKIHTGEMPPAGFPKPDARQVKAITGWLHAHFARLDRNLKPDPGRVTARRLNRPEYNHTIRDLLAVDFRPADDFPADDSGYGFDNIGDVLSLSPLLMEKYLTAAEKIARSAIPDHTPLKPVIERFRPDRLKQVNQEAVSPETFSAGVQVAHKFPVEAEYDLQADLAGSVINQPAKPLIFKVAVWLDDRQVASAEINRQQQKPWIVGERVRVAAGGHQLKVTISYDGERPELTDKTKQPLGFNAILIKGPYNQSPPAATESYKRVFTCGHAYGAHQPSCANKVLADFARRAYRRPVEKQEVNALARFVEMAQREGDTFEQGIRLALQAALVSPHFLFRIERDPESNRSGMHRINDHELASRLSYFLWSSMPDEELMRLAGANRLNQPQVLAAQVRRMLRDPKSKALVENFGGQWLQLRNLEEIKPDPDRFPTFTPELRDAMRRETEMFFDAIIKEDRSVVDFLDGRFTFVNETLARHYGIAGVTGSEFRRITLDGSERSGVLTHASVLTVSSYPTRTSPVIRGKWILENILNAPPPPPPPNVPNLDEKAVGLTGSLRQQLEEHRANPSCSACHARMDPLGFGLENYDAIGAWRTKDGKFPVDVAGALPDGRSFKTPGELKAILKTDRDAFAECLTEKLLIFALGRGLERYDRPTALKISQRLAADDYRFSRLVLEIVNSLPFQMRRGGSRREPINRPER